MKYEKILVTTDFSEDSHSAFDIASYEAKMSGSSITLLTVVEDWNPPEYILRQVPNPESISNYRQDVLKNATRKLEDLATTHFHGQAVSTEAILTEEGVANTIAEYAKSHGINLIVTSSHGKGAVENLFLGSVVQKIIRSAPCPVLVIPKKKD